MVFPHCEVQQLVAPSAITPLWRISYRTLGDRGGAGEISAPVAILAAGSLGSSRLLLKNRRRLKKLSPALGSRFSGNGDALAAAFDPRASTIGDPRTDFGPSMTTRLDYTAEYAFMVADGGLPTNFGGLLELVRMIDSLHGWRRLLLRGMRLLALVGITDRVISRRHLRPQPPRRPIAESLVFLMLGRDAANGQMRLTPLFKCFDIRWSRMASERLFESMREVSEQMARTVDAEPFFALDCWPLSSYITVHPLGGCPMADDPLHGVVDDAGKVYGYEGLYILDGSIIPSALGVNPSKTIAALAERGAEKLIASRADGRWP